MFPPGARVQTSTKDGILYSALQKALLPQLKQTNVSLARCWTDLGSRSDWSFSAIGRISDGFLPLHNPRPLPPSFPPVSQFSFPSSPPSPPLPGAPLQPPPVCSLLDEQGQGGRQTRKSHQTSTGDSAQTETPVDLAHRNPPLPREIAPLDLSSIHRLLQACARRMIPASFPPRGYR